MLHTYVTVGAARTAIPREESLHRGMGKAAAAGDSPSPYSAEDLAQG
jgi:hypothetical protein